MTFELLLPFETDSEEFALGFECGRIWALMSESPAMLPGLIFHAKNAEMIMRMVEKKGFDLKAKFTDDEQWMMLDDS